MCLYVIDVYISIEMYEMPSAYPNYSDHSQSDDERSGGEADISFLIAIQNGELPSLPP
jgi:hypothetical protein